MTLNATDRRLVNATQAGLPISPTPFADIAQRLGLSETEVIDRLTRLRARGVIRRVGIAPNHYRLGMTANGMTVWDVADGQAERLGAIIGARPEVTHCYLRPRARPVWPYNLFAMIHGASRDEVEAQRQVLADILAPHCAASDVLYSTKILKKTGLRLAGKAG